MRPAAVELGLDVLRPGLASDGFDLLVGSVESNGVVQVVLRAKTDACLECLVPEDLMVQMIEDSIRRQDPSLDHVELVKEGFEGIEGH